MDVDTLKKELKLAEDRYILECGTLIMKWVMSNNEFNVGDFVRCVLGIIKVDKVFFKEGHGEFSIVYHGYRYRQDGKTLIPVTSKENRGVFHQEICKRVDTTDMDIKPR